MKKITSYSFITICVFILIACVAGIIGNLTYKTVSSTHVTIDTIEDMTMNKLTLNVEGEKIISKNHDNLYFYELKNIKSFELIKKKNIFGKVEYTIGKTYKN